MATAMMLDGRKYVVLPDDEYRKLLAAAELKESELPALPKPDERGNFPAVAYARASLARKMILARRAAGLSQRALAELAGIRFETINRLETGKNTPDVATIEKIEKALAKPRKAKGK